MSRLVQQGALSLVDQAVLSLANFLVGIFLIQNTSKDAYGSYVVAFAVILLLIGVQNAIVTTQMTVLAPGKTDGERDHFCAALATGQYLVFGPLAALLLVVAAAGTLTGWLLADQSALIVAVAGTTMGVLFREFLRGLFFLRLELRAVLALDLLYVLALFVGLYCAREFAGGALHLLALWMLGVGSLVSAAAMLSVARLPWRQSVAGRAKALREAWVSGRWALGGVSVTWIQDQSYVYLLSLLAGAASAAEANAARLLLMPVMLLNAGMGRVTMPRWALLRQEGKRREIERTANRILGILVLVVAVYGGVLVLLQDYAIGWLLSDDYRSVGGFIVLWGAVVALQVVRSNFSVMLQVYQRFREITIANVVSALAVIGASFALIPGSGVKGSLVALLVGEVLLTGLLAVLWRRTG